MLVVGRGNGAKFIASLACFTAFAGFASQAAAQSVRGVVTRSQVPIAGVVVQLLDSANAVVARTLTDELGEYRFLAPRAGTYRLDTRRIGFSPLSTSPFLLRDGETRVQPLSVDGIAVSLDTVRVRSNRTDCAKADARNAEVALVWEQARTALMATDATLSGRAMSASLLKYQRTLYPDGQRTLQSMSLTDVDSVLAPWTSESFRELQRVGYVLVDKDSTSYRAPGLDVLASNEFSDMMCYRVVAAADSSLIALSFEPSKSKRGISELRGTITLDRRTAALRSLDFRYTNLRKVLEDAGAGGRMEFVSMRDGSWAISRWIIRMPLIARTSLQVRRGLSVIETIDATEVGGGDLLVARHGADTLWKRSVPPVSGLVADSTTGVSIRGARLRLRNTNRETVTDSTGHFAFTQLMPGEYTMLVNTPSLDSLGAVSAVTLLVADTVATITVRVPNAARVMPQVCRISTDSVALHAPTGVLRGTVKAEHDSLAPSLTSVLVQWKDSTNAAPTILRIRTDDAGNYRFCEVPLNTAIDVRAEYEAMSSAVTSVTVAPSAPYVRLDLALERPLVNEAVVAGTVIDSSGTPLEGVAVDAPALNLHTLTDGRGVFRLAHVTAGSNLVTWRKLGYSAKDQALVLPPSAVTNLKIVLTRVQTIAAVTTTASMAWMRDFDENKKLGLGQFLTRDELAKKEAVGMGALLSSLRGTHVAFGRGNRATITSRRPGPSLSNKACYAQIFLDNQQIYTGRPGEPVPNINEYLVSSLEAIEWYAGPSETPGKYNNLNATCGVLVLHTRQSGV